MDFSHWGVHWQVNSFYELIIKQIELCGELCNFLSWYKIAPQHVRRFIHLQYPLLRLVKEDRKRISSHTKVRFNSSVSRMSVCVKQCEATGATRRQWLSRQKKKKKVISHGQKCKDKHGSASAYMSSAKQKPPTLIPKQPHAIWSNIAGIPRKHPQNRKDV